MDMELIKPATEDQMEMMMMLEMDKLPEFCNSFSDVPELNSIDFSGGTTAPVFDAPTTVTTPSLASPLSSMPFSSTAIQEPGMRALFAGATGGRLGNPGELSGENIYSSSVHKRNSMAAMREMIFRIAAMQPIHIDPESVKPPKRRNVKISKDPQSVAARHRRERISERIRILQRLVPGGTKMDTASMLDEAIQYVKFLKNQVQSLERVAANRHGHGTGSLGIPPASSSRNYAMISKAYQPAAQMFSPTQMLS